MAWTTPRTWVDGEVPDAAMFNTHIRDNMLHLIPEKDATAIAFGAGRFTINAGTFTVEAGDVLVEWFYRTGNRGRYTILIQGATLATPGIRLQINVSAALNGGVFYRNSIVNVAIAVDGSGVVTDAFAFARLNTAVIEIYRPSLDAWVASTNGVALWFTMPYVTTS